MMLKILGANVKNLVTVKKKKDAQYTCTPAFWNWAPFSVVDMHRNFRATTCCLKVGAACFLETSVSQMSNTRMEKTT
jgi:hypothetical protein